MGSTDYSFHSIFDYRPFYDWERMIISVGCDHDKIDFVNGISTEESRKYFARFVHEYIHFLQNFATAWGARVYIDFTFSLVRMGASSAFSSEMLRPPLDKTEIRDSEFVAGMEMRESVVRRMNKYGRVVSHAQGALQAISVTIGEEYTELHNGLLSAQVGIKSIRETMAYLGTQLFLQKSDDDIHVEIYDCFKMNDQPEYWMVFEYFYAMRKFSNLSRGLFHLMQLSLATIEPTEAVLRFFRWIGAASQKASVNGDFLALVNEWSGQAEQKTFFEDGLAIAKSHCNKSISMADRGMQENDLFRFAGELTHYALYNIGRNEGGVVLFDPVGSFDETCWRRLIVKYGTGNVRFMDATKIFGTAMHCSSMQDNFNFLMSCSLIFKQLIEDSGANCPFLENIPICQASFKGQDNCYFNPFLVTTTDGDDASCIFRNGVLLLGLGDRLDIKE